jgi:hypothetical protein
MSQEHDYHLSHGSSVWAAAALGLILVATGCKSGASFSKPSSWWAGGGSNDPSQLAAAPPFAEGASAEGTVAKPSRMASPYPTTTTPQGYAINDATANPQMPPATAQAAAGQPPVYPSTDDAAPVTYGQPAPTPMTYPDTAEMAGAAAAGGAAGGIAAQTGPYATLPTAAAPAPAAPPTPDTVVAPSRIADSRMGSSFGDSVSPAPAAAPPAAPESRYGDVNASRFGGSGFGAEEAAAAPPMAPATEPPLSTAPASAFPAPASSAPISSPPAATPMPSGSSLPATPPRRRPDPGYRPGGTSSYTTSSSILVGAPSVDPAVRAASFDTPAEPVVR